MRIKANDFECWIRDDVILPSNFDSMIDDVKWSYIYKNKLLHKENEPAIIYSSGTKEWYLNGLRHRLNGPAIISSHGDKGWYLCHKIDGPAFIFSDGTQWWLLNGLYVDEEIYKKIEKSSKEELLMFAVLPKYKGYISLIEYRLDII